MKQLIISSSGAKVNLMTYAMKSLPTLKKNIPTSKGYMSGWHSNIFPIGMRIVYLNIMKIHTSLNTWKRQAELPMWNAIKK